MAEQTPIPAEALAAAIEEAWRIAVCYGELVPDEAKRHLSVTGLTPHMALNRAQVGTVVTRIAPILLAAGRTAAAADALNKIANEVVGVNAVLVHDAEQLRWGAIRNALIEGADQ